MTWLCHACLFLSALIKATEAVQTIRDNVRSLKRLEPDELLEIVNHCYPKHTAAPGPSERRRRETKGSAGNSSGEAEEGAIVEERVYNGQVAGPGEFPAAVSLSVRPIPHLNTEFICAGTLISRRHVLTAAHCFADMENDPYTLEIRIQGLCRYGGDSCRTELHTDGRMRLVEWKVVYWQTDFEVAELERSNDLAIIELKSAVVFVPGSLEFACIWPGSINEQYMRQVLITGWGLYVRPTLADGAVVDSAPQLNWQSPASGVLRKGVHVVNTLVELASTGDSGSGIYCFPYPNMMGRKYLLGVHNSALSNNENADEEIHLTYLAKHSDLTYHTLELCYYLNLCLPGSGMTLENVGDPPTWPDRPTRLILDRGIVP